MNRNTPFPHRRPILRWVDYARRSWQRLGHLRILCSLAHPAIGTNLEGLTVRYKNVITSLEEIPKNLEEQVREYVRTHRTNRYPRRRGPVSRVELQDLYLSDPRLPSQSGAITGDMDSAGYRHAVYVEIPTWAVRLRLLRSDNYTLTDRGKVLLQLRQGIASDIRLFDLDTNPYLLTPGERYFFCYCILDIDGDLLQGIFSSLLQKEDSFVRREIGHIAAQVLTTLSSLRLSGTTGRPERLIKERIAATVRSIANQKGTGMGPCESVTTPRTEPLVDCGVLERTHRTSYMYRMSEKGRLFGEALAQVQSIDDFLQGDLAKWASRLSGTEPIPYSDPHDVWHYVAQSYSLLRSGLGYCSIREVALLAVAMAIDDGANVFEIADAEQAISENGRKYGKDVRFTKSRQGDIAQVRIAPRLLAEFVNG